MEKQNKLKEEAEIARLDYEKSKKEAEEAEIAR